MSQENIEYRNAQVLSVSGQTAWVAMEGGDGTPVRVGMESYISLPLGEYKVGDCNWATGGDDESGDEFELEDETPDGEVWVEVRKLRGGPYRISRIKGKQVQTLTYTIGDIADAPMRPYVPHPSALIRWAYMTLDSENDNDPVKYSVYVGDVKVISGQVESGKDYSKRKRAAKLKRTAPSKKLKVEITDAGGYVTDDQFGGVVVIGYTE